MKTCLEWTYTGHATSRYAVYVEGTGGQLCAYAIPSLITVLIVFDFVPK